MIRRPPKADPKQRSLEESGTANCAFPDITKHKSTKTPMVAALPPQFTNQIPLLNESPLRFSAAVPK
jgi:hypothetical protein